MNKTDLENLNGYLFNTFNGVVKLDDKFNIEICYTTRMNTKLEKMIIIKSNFKKSYLKFCDYLLTSDVVNEIISTLYQFYLKDLTELTALKVNSIVLDMNPLETLPIIKQDVNPLETLPIIKQDVYKALPDTFETGEGKIIAKKLGMSDRTFGRFLDNKKLFKNIEWGKYEKRY